MHEIVQTLVKLAASLVAPLLALDVGLSVHAERPEGDQESGALAYPVGGRGTPPDERADDFTHWRTVMMTDEITSPKALRDPDGDVMEIEHR